MRLAPVPARAALLAAGVAAAPAAAETSRTFEIAAQIVSGCMVATDNAGRWGSINLGTVAGVAGASVAAGLVSTAGAGVAIECTPGVSAALSADNGDNPAGGERQLKHAGSTATIRYRLFADGATTPWAGLLPLAFTGGARIVPIRAVATLAAPMAAGAYTDTVRVTLSW